MDVQVGSVSFRQNEADATVIFQAKGSKDPAASMTMKYVLEQKDGQWVVKGRSGANSHGGAAGQSSGPHNPPPPTGGELPPGHPPTSGTPKSGSEGKQ
jgi:hypothetical protein